MKINSLIKMGLSSITIGMLLTGCAVDEFARKYSPDNVKRMVMNSLSSKNKGNFEKDFSDKHLAKTFKPFYDEDGYSFNYTKNSVKIQKQLVYFSQNIYMKNAFSYVQNNASETNLTKAYKKAILDRGNYYKVYTGKFNKEVIKIAFGRQSLGDFRKSNMRYLKWDLVPLVAEYDPNNELVSLMMTNVEVGAAYDQVRNPNVQSEIELTAIIYVNKALNPIKNNLSKKEWEDNLISQSK